MAGAGASLREKYKSTNSLICLLQGIMNRVTTVELRNESTATGLIENVDGFMNIKMKDVTFVSSDGTKTKMDEFFVQGPQIRYVQIPDDVNMMQVMNAQLPGMGRGLRKGRGTGRGGNTSKLPQPD
ncbi:U7 snRNA-associated Sm-like protein LSm10 [Amphiura filiformis]|uniref:U7 snRNA-associated Sm-like protein LSm10 n=1 Tax=Amphiura filiformis TaxID=82378 RepID=UPI003B20DC9A